ncbi:ABC transporter permease [Jidongwangia harbinensis]|uniref:ABC transporter permease n=1 Tax=Jidongwangia harbinensis TaxID=2878561 RepID=UPI001CD98FB0|nr:ABC-2 family transporter protein [Jidongwangia harbinensis]MCA2216673.1 ABC-2 family transporter protein [Jidongwangia harbinensis]
MRAHHRTLTRLAWGTVLAYRADFVLQLLGVAVQTVAVIAVWRVVTAGGTGSAAGLTWDQLKAYLLIAFATGTLMSGFTDWQLAERVLSGNVALELVKPVDYQLARFAEALGYVAGEVVVVLAMGTVLLVAFGGVPVPGGAQAVLFLISLLAVIPLKFGLIYLSGMACFWTESYYGVGVARVAVTNILSGALVPIALYPDWLQALCRLSPFPGIVSTPALVFLGEVGVAEAVRLIAWQFVWIAVLWLGARTVWRLAVTRFSAHGG